MISRGETKVRLLLLRVRGHSIIIFAALNSPLRMRERDFFSRGGCNNGNVAVEGIDSGLESFVLFEPLAFKLQLQQRRSTRF